MLGLIIKKRDICILVVWIEIFWKLKWCGLVENKSIYLFIFRKRFF